MPPAARFPLQLYIEFRRFGVAWVSVTADLETSRIGYRLNLQAKLYIALCSLHHIGTLHDTVIQYPKQSNRTVQVQLSLLVQLHVHRHR